MTKYSLLLLFFAVMCAAGLFEHMMDVALLGIGMAAYTAFKMKRKFNRNQRKYLFNHPTTTEQELAGTVLQFSND